MDFKITQKKQFPIYLVLGLITLSLFFEFFLTPPKNIQKEDLKVENKILKTINGEEFQLFPQDGIIVLNFFATWCNPCISEFPALEKISRDYKDQKVTVLGVLSDGSRGDLIKLQQRLGLTFPIFDDVKGDLSREFAVTGFPETFILSKDGIEEIYDLYEGSSSKRIVGPRPWSNSSYRKEINKLIKLP